MGNDVSNQTLCQQCASDVKKWELNKQQICSKCEKANEKAKKKQEAQQSHRNNDVKPVNQPGYAQDKLSLNICQIVPGQLYPILNPPEPVYYPASNIAPAPLAPSAQVLHDTTIRTSTATHQPQDDFFDQNRSRLSSIAIRKQLDQKTTEFEKQMKSMQHYQEQKYDGKRNNEADIKELYSKQQLQIKELIKEVEELKLKLEKAELYEKNMKIKQDQEESKKGKIDHIPPALP